MKDNLKQCSALYGAIQAHLAQWQRDKDTSVVTAVDETADGEDVETVEETAAVAVSVDKGGDNENSLESFVGKICDKKSDEVDESDRHSIISALYQIALTDDENFTRTEYIASLMEGKGFEVVHQMSTKELYTVLYFAALKFRIYT